MGVQHELGECCWLVAVFFFQSCVRSGFWLGAFRQSNPDQREAPVMSISGSKVQHIRRWCPGVFHCVSTV